MTKAEEGNERRMAAAVAPFLGPDFFFVNVGAFDGVTNDPIYPLLEQHAWRGIAIEPVPDVFRRLEETYRRVAPQAILVNAAISDVERPIWCIAEGKESFGDVVDRKQMSSMDREHLEGDLLELFARYEAAGSVKMPAVDDLLQAVPVRCVTFNDLMAEHEVDHVDLLNIDAEGVDLEVLRSIDLDRYCPNVLVIEVSGMTRDERTEMRALLSSRGLRRAFTYEPFSTVFVREPAPTG